MHSIDLIRKINARVIASLVGLGQKNPRTLDSQRALQSVIGQIGTLPTKIGGVPAQDLDPTSPTFGKFYFIPDYDPPSNPDGLPFR